MCERSVARRANLRGTPWRLNGNRMMLKHLLDFCGCLLHARRLSWPHTISWGARLHERVLPLARRGRSQLGAPPAVRGVLCGNRHAFHALRRRAASLQAVSHSVPVPSAELARPPACRRLQESARRPFTTRLLQPAVTLMRSATVERLTKQLEGQGAFAHPIPGACSSNVASCGRCLLGCWR